MLPAIVVNAMAFPWAFLTFAFFAVTGRLLPLIIFHFLHDYMISLEIGPRWDTWMHHVEPALTVVGWLLIVWWLCGWRRFTYWQRAAGLGLQPLEEVVEARREGAEVLGGDRREAADPDLVGADAPVGADVENPVVAQRGDERGCTD